MSTQKTMKRTMIADTPKNSGKSVTINGWIHSRRDMGKIIFLDIRDRTGIIQAVFSPDKGDSYELAQKLRSEYVVKMTGNIKDRPERMVNKNLVTGTIEMEATGLEIVSESEEMPIDIKSEGTDINEDHRGKFKYLDLRRERMAHNMRMRHKTIQFIREYLTKDEFVEIETPILTKATPEGARDFLVPSRLQNGSFYALPQSPQQYKQLLMVGGFEKYFQIARCFRDEDPRADRAYGEFTQLDLEMSFTTQEEIMELIETMYTGMIKELYPEKKITETPWPRIDYKDSMEKYSNDKPDLRKNKDDKDELAFAWIVNFPLFEEQSEDDYFHGGGEKFAPSHHMFTAPHPDDVKLLDKDPLKVRGLQHDLALNGFEVGGGSIRIHDPKVQQKVFDLIGFNKKQQAQFDHMLTAFKYGVPPHGGIAPGIDRLLMVLLGEDSLREVIAFPMTSSGSTAIMNAPSEATKEQLDELGIQIKE